MAPRKKGKKVTKTKVSEERGSGGKEPQEDDDGEEKEEEEQDGPANKVEDAIADVFEANSLFYNKDHPDYKNKEKEEGPRGKILKDVIQNAWDMFQSGAKSMTGLMDRSSKQARRTFPRHKQNAPFCNSSSMGGASLCGYSIAPPSQGVCWHPPRAKPEGWHPPRAKPEGCQQTPREDGAILYPPRRVYGKAWAQELGWLA
uniref:Uncharacterized protein n=1 Tax=Branchiostoma floridae TaxID=7739 RepID=C3Z3Z6_BRAFL|eukprot:XP_002596597.1 hypothetical protein BRAFLDRAFT_78506 [Branchiostoma floridae]